MARVGDVIAQVRAEKGLTQSRLAELAKTSQSAISQIEKGERSPSFATVAQIAKALDVGVADLLGVVPAELEEADAVHFRKRKQLSDASREQLDKYLTFLLGTQGRTE
jgi:transcriptional regulator with XRE-family HTH domain